MKTTDKQKICSNCHGRISTEAEICPYCAHEQQMVLPTKESSVSQADLFQQRSLQDSLASLYSPPYASKAPQFLDPEKNPLKKEKSSYAKAKASDPLPSPYAAPAAGTVFAASPEEEAQAKNESKGSFWSLLLLLLGSNLFTLGLAQLFFSEGSVLRLEWSSEHWYFYCLFAIPLIFMGVRFANRLR